jgi:hypothetical protein
VVGRDHLGAALEPVDQGLRDATGLQKTVKRMSVLQTTVKRMSVF